jgi:hypothetical protein
MGRHSVRRYRPLHSAHGPLYWAVVMWPVMLTRAARPRRRTVAAPQQTAPAWLDPMKPVGGPAAARAVAWDTWQVGEGTVAPRWEDHHGSVALR